MKLEYVGVHNSTLDNFQPIEEARKTKKKKWITLGKFKASKIYLLRLRMNPG